MTTRELTQTLNDKRLATLLPLIDAVWDDGELTDTEIAAVCMALLRDPTIDLSCKDALAGWLDPEHPPTSRDLEALRSHLGTANPGAPGA